MNALPSFEPPKYRQQPRRSSGSKRSISTAPVIQSPLQVAAPGRFATGEATRTRVKSNPAYAHRRQGLEVAIKLVTYSALSIFGMVTLVNSIGYNWAQHGKFQHLATELKDAQARTEKVNHSFSRSFDPQLQRIGMTENSYKVAPERRQIFIVNPAPTQSGSTTQIESSN
jgi:hypothetical protein